MKKLLRLYSRLVYWLMVILLAINLVSICVGVVTRYVFNMSISWTDELAGTSLVGITMMGAAYATIRDNHMDFSGLMNRLPARGRSMLKIIINLLILVFVCITIYASYTGALLITDRLSSLPIKKSWVILIIGFSCVVMLFAYIDQIVDNIKTLVGRKKTEKEEAA